MWVLGTIVDVHVLEQLGTKTVLGKHTLDYLKVEGVHTGLEVFLVRLLEQNLGVRETLSTGIASVANILVVGPLLAGQNALLGIDDDHVVTAVYVRGKIRFVLAAQQLGNL